MTRLRAGLRIIKSLSFVVVGTPKPQPRPRATIRNGRAGVYNPPIADEWKRAVMVYAWLDNKPCDPFAKQIKVTIHFYLPRPKTLKTVKKWLMREIYHTSKPDIDNLIKSTLDALTDCGMWHDDSQICIIEATKMYESKPDGSGAYIIIEEIEV